jgi:tetratricopeptide (TPR) repeat protein
MPDSKKRCFVIMPYGGASEERERHYSGVFHSIIKAAAERAGFEAMRSDTAGEPGNITQAVIRDLLDADIVIADLTEANANVFFELGVRHAFRKSGTVHIVDEKHNLPFDVHQYRAIKYSENLADLPGTIDEIIKQIRLREALPGKPDNPVHEAIATLPIDIRSTGDSSLKSRIADLERTAEQLTRERDDRQRQLDRLDPTGVLKEEGSSLDVDKVLDQADQEWAKGVQHVLLALTRAADEGGPEALAKELRTALKSPYLTESDFMGMALMCRRFGLEQHYLAVLEVARDRYPANGRLLIRLANAYLSSPSRDVRTKARIIMESYLGIELKDGEPIIQGRRGKAKGAIGTLCDVYFEMDRPEWVLSVTSSVENTVGDSVVLRNKARALGVLGRHEEAEAEFQSAIARFPTDDTVHTFYANFLENENRYEEAYAHEEEALRLDPRDGRRWMNLAISIVNYGYCKIRGTMIGGPALSAKERMQYAVPLLARAVEINPALRVDVIGVLVRERALKEANEFNEGRISTEGYNSAVLDGIEQSVGDWSLKDESSTYWDHKVETIIGEVSGVETSFVS